MLPEKAKNSEEAGASVKSGVLIIEDDEPTLESILFKLKKLGFAAESATDAIEGLEKLRAEPKKFAAVLLDLRLPRGDGFFFLEERKKDEKICGVPVIVFTNLSQADFVNRALSLGVKGYLVKAHHSVAEIAEELKKCIEGKACVIDR